MNFKINFVLFYIMLLVGCTKKESPINNTLINGLTITTVAGGGTGDNGILATSAWLRLPYSIFVDASGNIYFTDCSVSNRVRKVNTNGIINTVAGDGIPGNLGFSGDGGFAINAQLYYPFGVVGDLDGNIYFTDSNNHRVRKIDNNGIITTIAGGGSSRASGPLPAVAVSLNSPAGITMDATGNIYFADYSLDMIFKINTQGILSLVAGNGNPNYRGDGGLATAAGMNPMGLKLDAAGNIYFADKSNNRIRKIDKAGIITTVAGNGTQGFSGDGGLATSAQLNQPVDIAIGDSGIIYISDWWNNRIRKVDPNGVISTFAGKGISGFGGDGGDPLNAVLQNPQGLFIDSKGALYIGDAGNGRIRKIK